MKIKSLLIALLLLVASPLAAQTTTTRTALSVALAAGSQFSTVGLASVTGITASTSSAQTFIYVEGEQMRVTAVNTTAVTVTVVRGVRGNAVGHSLGATVWYGAPGNFDANTGNTSGVFVTTDPLGLCTRANNQNLPVINPVSHNISDCILSPPLGSPTAAAATTSEWVSYSTYQNSNARPYKKLAVSATTYTLLPTDHILGYNTAVAGTITIPALTGWVGKEYIVQIEITGSTSLTIATSTGQLINGAASIILGGATSFSGARIYSDGSNWFTSRAQ